MKGAGFAAADDDDDAVLGHYMFEEEDEEFAHADVASEDDLQLSQAVVSEEPLGPVEKVAAEDAKSQAGMSHASASGLKTAATDFDTLKKCLGDSFPATVVPCCLCTYAAIAVHVIFQSHVFRKSNIKGPDIFLANQWFLLPQLDLTVWLYVFLVWPCLQILPQVAAEGRVPHVLQQAVWAVVPQLQE